MRISDWSSDVCSSDLLAVAAIVAVVGIRRLIVGRWARGQLLLGHRDQLLLFFRRVLVLDAKTVALDDARRGLVANQRITLLLALRRALAARAGVRRGLQRTGIDDGRADIEDRKSKRLNSSH